jgi:hypothetical protein
VEIKINNHPVEFQLEEENTIADVVDYFIDWSNERELVLFRIEIDGEFFTADDLPDKNLSDMQYMNFIIESKADLVFSSVDEGARYCDRAAKVIDRIISDDEYGIEELRHLPSGIDWIQGVFHSVLGILDVSPQEFRYRDRSLEDYLGDLLGLKSEIPDLKDRKAAADYFSSRERIFVSLKEIFRILLLSDEMKAMILHSIDSPDIIVSTLQSLREHLDGEVQNIEEIAVAFQSGKDSEGASRLQRFIDFFFSYSRVCYQVAPVFGIELSEVVNGGISLLDRNRRIQDMLNETIEIMENQDYISLSDILEYEIRPLVSDLGVFMDLLLSSVREK